MSGGQAHKMLGMAERERNKVNCVTGRRVGFISGCDIGSRDILNLLLVRSKLEPSALALKRIWDFNEVASQGRVCNVV